MLSDEEAIDNVNPFVMHDFSLPGGVRQTGSFEDFSEMRSEPGIGEPTRSVYCDYGLCAESTSACSLSRPLHPRRNIDVGFTQNKRSIVDRVRVGVANNPTFSIIGAFIIAFFIFSIIYYTRR